MNPKVFGAIALAVSVFLAVGVLTFAGPCVHDDGTVSACFGASRAVLAAAAVAAVAALASLALRNGKAAGACAAAAACAGAFAAFAPGNVFALCMMHTMRCWTAMQPFALACGCAIAVLSVVAAVMSFKRG